MKNGIKVLLFITCILFLKFFSTFFINQIITLVETNKISAGHARALLAVEDSVKQKELALLIIEKGLNVRDVESLIKNIDKVKQISLPKEKSLEIKDFEERIKRLLSTKV